MHLILAWVNERMISSAQISSYPTVNFPRVPPDKKDSHSGLLPRLEDSPKCSFPNISHVFNIVPGIFQAKKFWIKEKRHPLVHWVGVQPIQKEFGGQSGECWCLWLSAMMEQFSVSVCTALNNFPHLLQEWFLPGWKKQVEQGCWKSSAARFCAMSPKQPPGRLLLCHKDSPELALGCHRQREGSPLTRH